ncbi:nucleotidyltransferase domain-containing protein [bacterium]
MLHKIIISTATQKVLQFFLFHPDQKFYEREIAYKVKIGLATSHRVLNALVKEKAIEKVLYGNRCYYNLNLSNIFLKEYKLFVNLLMMENIVDKIKSISNKIVLFGSMAKGEDVEKSDIDLYIVSSYPQKVQRIINKLTDSKKTMGRKIQAVIVKPEEVMQGKRDEVFLDEIRKGNKILWERVINDEEF